MKKRSLIISLLTSIIIAAGLATSVSAETINWFSYKDGKIKAKAEGKKIYINFHADWCYYCKVMAKTTFKDKSVISFLNEKFVAISVDTVKEKRLARDYMVQGLPSNWFLEPDGEKIGLKPGYLKPKQLLENLKFVYEEKYKNK